MQAKSNNVWNNVRTSHEACERTEKDISQPYTGAVAKKKKGNIINI